MFVWFFPAWWGHYLNCAQESGQAPRRPGSGGVTRKINNCPLEGSRPAREGGAAMSPAHLENPAPFGPGPLACQVAGENQIEGRRRGNELRLRDEDLAVRLDGRH